VTDKEDKLRLEVENNRLRELLAQAGLDAAKSDVARDLQNAILQELQHRVKNLLTLVQSITLQSLRSASDLRQAQEAVQHRMNALSATHDALFNGDGERAKLSIVLASAIEPFNASQQVTIKSAADVDVPAAVAMNLALAVNELATNATKYGSLSVPGGSVDLVSVIDETNQILQITWVERGGPRVQSPQRKGFGRRVIESTLGSWPVAETDLQFDPTGVVCQFRVPLAALSS
jgi:two-component sensor histidine kinase